LIQANNLRPPYRLDKGQRLTIPGVRYHRVAAGETLYGISRRYSVSPYALARTNRVAAPYKIRPGQKLRLPASEAKLAVRRPANTAPQPRRGEALKPVIKPAVGEPGERGSRTVVLPGKPETVAETAVPVPTEVPTPTSAPI
jgi:LysM repeat protein